MPLNSLYAVWAIVFSVVLLGLQPTAQLVAGVLISFAGAVIVVSSGSRAPGGVDRAADGRPRVTRRRRSPQTGSGATRLGSAANALPT